MTELEGVTTDHGARTTDQAPDLRHVAAWLFDLDNTLYPHDAEVGALMDARITAVVRRCTGLSHEDARALQKRYLHEHGTSLAGLMADHGVEPHAFLEEVHDVSLESLRPDPVLRAAIQRLPGRRLVFTNASAAHAERVLARLMLDDLFEAVFHIEAAGFASKPSEAAFEAVIAAHEIDPARTCFFEDSPRNLAPAAARGMTTVLVGPHAADPLSAEAAFVHHRSAALAPFLQAARVREAPR